MNRNVKELEKLNKRIKFTEKLIEKDLKEGLKKETGFDFDMIQKYTDFTVFGVFTGYDMIYVNVYKDYDSYDYDLMGVDEHEEYKEKIVNFMNEFTGQE